MNRDPSVLCRLGSSKIGSDDEKAKLECVVCGRAERYPLWYPTDLLGEQLEPWCLRCALKRHASDGCPCLDGSEHQ